MKIIYKFPALVIALVAMVFNAYAQTGYTLYWENGKDRDFISNSSVERLEYVKNNQGKWNIQFIKGENETKIGLVDTINVLTYDLSKITCFPIGISDTMWITPEGYFLKNTDNLNEEDSERTRILYTSLDKSIEAEIIYGEDKYSLLTENEVYYIAVEQDSIKITLFGEDINDGEENSYQHPNDTNPYSSQTLMEPLYRLVNCGENIDENYKEINDIIQRFSSILPLDQTISTQSAKKISTTIQEQKKQNRYSIFVHTWSAESLLGKFAYFEGMIRCATYRFNYIGEYGFLISNDEEKLDDKNIKEALKNGHIFQIRCDNQTHLSLDYSGIWQVPLNYSASRKVYFRAYYKLKDSSSNLFLKHPSKYLPNHAFGKIKTLNVDSFNTPIFHFSGTQKWIYKNSSGTDGECVYDNFSGTFRIKDGKGELLSLTGFGKCRWQKGEIKSTHTHEIKTHVSHAGIFTRKKGDGSDVPDVYSTYLISVISQNDVNMPIFGKNVVCYSNKWSHVLPYPSIGIGIYIYGNKFEYIARVFTTDKYVNDVITYYL